MWRVNVSLPVQSCEKKSDHPWHLCKPGGSRTWVCPGRGPRAMPDEDTKYGREPERVTLRPTTIHNEHVCTSRCDSGST